MTFEQRFVGRVGANHTDSWRRTVSTKALEWEYGWHVRGIARRPEWLQRSERGGEWWEVREATEG